MATLCSREGWGILLRFSKPNLLQGFEKLQSTKFVATSGWGGVWGCDSLSLFFGGGSVTAFVLVYNMGRPAKHQWNKLEKLVRERQRIIAISVAESEKAEETFGPHGEGTIFLFFWYSRKETNSCFSFSVLTSTMASAGVSAGAATAIPMLREAELSPVSGAIGGTVQQKPRAKSTQEQGEGLGHSGGKMSWILIFI